MSAGCLILYKDGHGAKLQEKNVEITENGNTTVIPNNNFNGLSRVTINTNVPTYVKSNSLEELNTLQNVKEGTLGLINGDENCVLLVPFGLGIKTKKLYFNTTKDLKDIIYRGASEKLYDFMNVASSGYSESDFDGSDYFQPNSFGIIDCVSQEGERMVGVWANTTQEKTYDLDSITRIYDINSGTWIIDNIEFSQDVTFSNIYCMRFLETPNLYAELTTDDFIHMNEWISSEVIGYSAIYQYIDGEWILVGIPEDQWSTALKTALVEGHGDWQKDDMLQMYQSDAEVFKTWNTIPAFIGPTYKLYSYSYIPDLPLPNNVANIFSGWKNIRRVPDSMDFTVKSNIAGLFFNCYSLEEIPFNNKELATSSLQGSFKNCYSLSGDIIIKAPNCSLLNAAFSYSLNIESITLETAPIMEFLETFYNCTNLKSIYGFRPSENAIYFNSVFIGCSSLKNLTFASDAVISNNLVLFYSNSLTVDSIMNVIDVLKDYTGGTAHILQLGATNLAKLTDEQKAIATNKNWVLQ